LTFSFQYIILYLLFALLRTRHVWLQYNVESVGIGSFYVCRLLVTSLNISSKYSKYVFLCFFILLLFVQFFAITAPRHLQRIEKKFICLNRTQLSTQNPNLR